MARQGGVSIDVEFDDNGLLDRMRRFPRKLRGVLRETLLAGLDILHEKVPPYPQRPAQSTYRRGGTLGGSFGVSMEGGMIGRPDIHEVRIGQRTSESVFGSKLNYAEFVVGERQARIHQGRWWTMKDVARRSQNKIRRVFQSMMEEIARFLERGV